jgi:leucyl aminopeptidase (aminopeptidase T)
MNKKIAAVAAVGLGSLMLIGTTGSAFAAEASPSPISSATPKPTTSHTADPAKKALREANATARQAAHATLKAAIEKAKADYQAVLATNPSNEVKAAAKAARKAAVESARGAHFTAMKAINPNWTPHPKGERKEASAPSGS